MQGKKVLLGVTGGIAAYKSPDLVRRLREQGAEVQVVLTSGAREFVTAMTFQAVSGREVRSDLWDPEAEKAMSHIELARWADFVVIAPATADFIARLATGQADDLLTTLCLATSAPIALAPAMNRVMWANPATQANVATLKSRGIHVWGPGEGDQACGETGAGRMLEPTQLAGFVANSIAPTGPLAGKRLLLTAGPTRERIDPVRFISNRSSGKMGFALAAAARDAGAEVTLISGPVNLATPAGIKRVDVESAADMLSATLAHHRWRRYLHRHRGRRRLSSGLSGRVQDQEDVGVHGHQDGAHRRHPRHGGRAQRQGTPFVVGFAAETDSVEQYARQKLLKKNLDMIAANEVGHDKVFEKDDNALLVLWRDGRLELPHAPKVQLARDLVALIAERFAERAKPRLASISA